MYSHLKHFLPPLYIFIFSFFIISQLGKHFFFNFSYLSGIRIDYLAPTLYFTDILSFIFILTSIVHLFKLMNWTRNHLFLSLFICILIVINYFFALSKPLWIYNGLRVVQWVSLFYFFKTQSKNKSIFTAVIYGFLIGGFFELALSLLQLSARHSVQGWWYYLGERSFSIFTPGIAKAYFMGREFLRPYGTFSHPNSLGGFYLLVYAFILTQKKITNWVLKGAFLFVSSALILISFSRTAIAVYILINLLYFSRNFVLCKTCFLAKVTIAFVLILFVLSISGDVNSFQKRTDFFEKSLSIIAQKPFTGTGMGSYLIAQHQYPQKFSTFFEQPVHNIFLLTIAQLGIPFSILLFISIYRLVPRSLGEGGYIEKYLKKMYFILPFICILITGSVDHYWITLTQNLLVLAVVFGIMVSYEKTSPRN